MLTARVMTVCGLLFGFTINQPARSVESPAVTPFFATDPVFGSKTYIERWGDPSDPPVVLIHGLGNNGARDWQRLAPQLAENHHVLTFDLPGFGRSAKDNKLYSPQRYTHFIRWVTDTYLDRPFVLIGHSMGGTIALNFAATYPNRLSRLIVIDAAGILHRVAFTTHLFDELKPAWWWDAVPASNSEKLRSLFGIDIVDLERLHMPIDTLLRSPIARRVFLGSEPNKIAGLALVQHNFSGLLKRISAPTLIIWGEYDAVAPLRSGRLLAARIPTARLAVINGAGHTPMREKPRELSRLILDALAEPAAQSSEAKTAYQPPDSTPAPDTDRTAECRGENNRTFSGSYTTITIVQCKRVLIRNATIGFLEIRSSSVEMIDSHVGHQDRALQIENSVLVATATEFSADVPIVIADSRLDLAGTTIIAGKQPVAATGRSTALFSVSELRSPHGNRRLHGVIWLSESQQLQ